MDDPGLQRNVRVLLAVSALFGLAYGIYDLALPLYLRSRHFTQLQGSLVFAVPVLATIVLRLCVGRISDRLGRKLFYSLSLLGCSLASFLTPFSPGVAVQVSLRSLRDACVEIRGALHSIFLYETAREKFIHLLGRTEGLYTFAQGAGLILVGYGLGSVLPGAWVGGGPSEGYLPVLLFSSLVFLAAFLLLAGGLRERFAPALEGRSSFLSELLSLKLDTRLYVLMLCLLIFNVGLGASHGYIMYEFWQDKFHVGRAGMGWIMALHRLAYALPLWFAARIYRGSVHRHRRLVLIVLIAVQGLTTAAAGVIPVLGLAVAVWLLHDLFGAGAWRPVMDSLVQRYCRGHVRGTDTAKALAFSQAGMVVGMMMGGWCYTSGAADLLRRVVPRMGGEGKYYGLAFVAGGAFAVLSVIPLFVLLVLDRAEDDAAQGPRG